MIKCFNCACETSAHRLFLKVDREQYGDESIDLYLEFKLDNSHLSFWQKLKVALGYLFNKHVPGVRDQFATWILHPEDCLSFIKTLEEYAKLNGNNRGGENGDIPKG
jgi:hypothetical protein